MDLNKWKKKKELSNWYIGNGKQTIEQGKNKSALAAI